MSNLVEIIITLLGPSGPILVLGAIGLLLVTLTLPFILVKKKDPFDRIQSPTQVQLDPKLTTDPSTALRHAQRNGPNLDKFAAFLEPQDMEEFSKSKLNLLRAGYRSKDAVRNFHFIQLALAIAGLIAGTVYVLFLSGDAEFTNQLLMAAGPAGVGYYLPIYWVNSRVAKRKTVLETGFPDSLDLMLVCVEAGQSLDQSIARVGKELVHSYPQLADEYVIIANEMRAGKEKASVLKDFAERADVADIKSFVTVLVQSAQFGTSIGDSLRIYASEMRDKRIMNAEEKANKLPTKMTLCTMGFTVPPLMVLLVGPSVYQIMQVLG